MPRSFFTFGDELSAAEARQVIATLLPAPKRNERRPPMPKLIAALHNAAPNRFDHEVNRIRGLAFDSGEHGFSHTVVSA